LRLEQLTFTRYIAALTVVFFHFGETVFPANNSWLNPVITAGPIAVSYFFVLSGFIMAVAYYRPHSQQPLNKWKYWVARLARIYPVYLLALLLMIAANLKTEGSDPTTVFLSLSMMQAWVPCYPITLNSPGWSLSVEAAFYMLFPILLIIVQRSHFKSLAWFSLALWLITQLVLIYLRNTLDYHAHTPFHDFIYYHPLMHFNTFILGFVVGALFCDGKFTRRIPDSLNTLLLFVVSLCIVLLLAYEAHIETLLGFVIDYNNGLIAPLFLLFIVILALNQGWISRLLSLPFLVLLGEASYSLYILQRPAYGIYDRIVGQHLSGELHFYLFAIGLTIAAILSYKLFETPARRFINGLYVKFSGSSGKSGSSRTS